MGKRRRTTTSTASVSVNSAINSTILNNVANENSYIYQDSFENGTLASFWNKEYTNNDYAMQLVSNPNGDGTKVLRFELRKTDSDVAGSRRAELSLNCERPLEEHTYCFKTYLPTSYAIDPNSAEIIAQWHNYPDANEEWTSPPLALGTKNGSYYLKRMWDDAKITTTSQMTSKGNVERVDLGSYSCDIGKWVIWKIHVKWGWLISHNPTIEVYKNDIKVYEAVGKPNTTNDDKGVYMKIGIYKWDWKENNNSILNTRIIYFDDIKIS